MALVTGGARRLGKEISIALAEAGFDIALNYNNTAKDILDKTIDEIKKYNVKVIPIKCDVSNVSEIKRMFVEVMSHFDRLDLLINNAAIFEHVEFLDIDEKTFNRFIDTNLKSTFFCSQEAIKIMLDGKQSIYRIVNLASLGGIQNWTGYIPYSVSKAGVIKLTQQLAKKFAPKIIVNAIAPGTILIEDDANGNVNLQQVKNYPVKRFGNAGDITSLVKYLALENSFITGQTFIVDGGRVL